MVRRHVFNKDYLSLKVVVADHGNAALRVCRLLREEEVKAKLRKMMQAPQTLQPEPEYVL